MNDNKIITCLDMKTVKKVTSLEIAQNHINKGWYLINAGITSNGKTSDTVYILGNLNENADAREHQKINFEFKQND